MADPFFITTAIDYTNAPPHIGHAYEKILADVLARYHRLKGDEVFFLTGVDQHGQKVQQSAEKQGIPPQEFVDGITAKFKALWEKLDVRYDEWAETTSPRHKDCVRAILTRLNAEGQIYKAKRAGYYSVRQEQFLTDKERNEQGEFGPEWGQVEHREEENYYFRLAEHKDWLLQLIEKRSAKVEAVPRRFESSESGEGAASTRRPLVVPDFRVAELRNAVEKLEGDLCISRPKSRLSWGIPFPFDEDFVTYVWFDALVNYLSFAPGHEAGSREQGAGREQEAGSLHDPCSMPPAFRRLWRSVVHDIGKDILIPAHGVYWPIMLKALGFTDEDMPTFLVHGWWNIAGAKMSKSEGNVVDPDLLADKYGAEALRYYLMADIATGRDADFSEDRLIQRYNSDLANSLGNLLNRSLNMAAKYREGRLRIHGTGYDLGDMTQGQNAKLLVQAYKDCLDGNEKGQEAATRPDWQLSPPFQIEAALKRAFELAAESNRVVELSAPWKLAKDESRAADLDCVLYTLAESLRIIAILISPVLPKAAAGIFAQLNWTGPMTLDDAQWGGLPDGHVLGTPTPLFPRIEAPAS